MNLANFLMMAPKGGEQGDFTSSMIMFGLIGLIFYFFMIRPQQKKIKQHQTMVEALKKSDQIILNSGIHGKVIEVQKHSLIIQSHESKLKVDKSSVAKVLNT